MNYSETILFSVILPVYNGEKYLSTAIESVVSQPLWKNTELIIINDGSTDKSLDICMEYKSKYRDIEIINQNNKGVLKSRNSGIKKANGDWLIFLDQDDTLINNCLNDSVVLLLDKCQFNKIDVICTPQIVADNNLENWKETPVIEGTYSFEDNKFSAVNEYYAFHYMLFNRKFIINNNLLFWEDSKYDKDAIFWEMAVFKAKKMYATNKFEFYVFRKNPNSVSHNWESIEFYEDLFNYNKILLEKTAYNLDLYKFVVPKLCFHYWRFSEWYFTRYYSLKKFRKISKKFALYDEIKKEYKNYPEYFTNELDLIFDKTYCYRWVFIKTRIRRIFI